MTIIDLLSLISLIASIASLVLAIIAIWIAFHHKKETDIVNRDTQKLLFNVGCYAKIISQIAMPELKAYGESMRNFVFRVRGEGSTGPKLSSQIESTINQALGPIKRDISELREEKSLDKIQEKLEILGKSFANSEERVKKELRNITEDIEIDLGNISKGQMLAPFGHFESFQELLDTIYLNYLRGLFPPYTYGREWVLVNDQSKTTYEKKGHRDLRTLVELGLKPGDRLILVKL